VKSCAGPKLMSLFRVAAFVLVEKTDEETVNEGFNKLIDGFVIGRIPIFDSGLTSTEVEEVDNADEVREEVLKSDEDD
jgi:hypothetical protein